MNSRQSYSFSAHDIAQVRRLLLDWYPLSRRKMPWRGDTIDGYPKPPPCSAYGTWVSEVMLQQTRVETVIAYWHKWMERFPSIAQLAAATPDEVNTYWAGLGYYRRAQNLLKGAHVVMEKFEGVIPQNVSELRTIPGIGPYTAGAIASVAYNKQECVVDGNVMRVLSRLGAYQLEGRELEKKCWEIARELVDPVDPSSFNQALMEFGATACKPQNPLCMEGKECPLGQICQAKSLYLNKTTKTEGDIEDMGRSDERAPLKVTSFPFKAVKKPPKEMYYGVCVVKYFESLSPEISNEVEGGRSQLKPRYLCIKRPSTGLLANQWEFPSVEISPQSSDDEIKELCFSHLLDTMGLQIIVKPSRSMDGSERTSKKKRKLSGLFLIQTEEVVCHPTPIAHVFSHEKHSMRVIEFEVDVNSSEALQHEKPLFEPYQSIAVENDSTGSCSRQISWMTTSELHSKHGMTTGLKKILRLIEGGDKSSLKVL